MGYFLFFILGNKVQEVVLCIVSHCNIKCEKRLKNAHVTKSKIQSYYGHVSQMSAYEGILVKEFFFFNNKI
jgi:hypothetical protein